MERSHDPSRRQFLQGVGSTAVLALTGALGHGTAAKAIAAPGSFRFVHLTDIHTQPELGAAQGWRQCVDKINSLDPRPDFVITGGDLIMDALGPDADRIDLQWRLFDEGLKELAMPVHHVIGNHDVGGWSPKSKLSRIDKRYGKALFAERYGRGQTYRSFDHQGWHFVLLDSIGQALEASTGYVGLIDDEQLDWLKQDLQQTGSETPIVLVTHIPFYSAIHQLMSGPEAPISGNSLVTNAHKFHRLLEPYDIRLVLSGHGHVQERIDLRGTTYVQSGAVCGRWWKGRVFDEAEAFGVVSCQGRSFDYHYQDYGWTARTS